MTDVHSGENLFDSVVADLSSEGASVKLERMVAVRKENSVTVAGDYLLPDDLGPRADPAGEFHSLARRNRAGRLLARGFPEQDHGSTATERRGDGPGWQG